MKIRCSHDALVLVDDLKPHPRNRNKHPQDQIERLAKVLEYQGWRYPVKISTRSSFVTAGHGRIEAAKLLGWTEVPVNFQDYDDEEMEYLDVIADNSIASWAELDLASINVDIGELGPFNLDLLGLKNFTVDVADKLPDGPVVTCAETECPKCGRPYQQ